MATQREIDLENSLRGVLDAIAKAEDCGCIDHLDAWDEADEEWYEILEEARDLLRTVDEEKEAQAHAPKTP